MKKITALIITVLLLATCLAFPVLANGDDIILKPNVKVSFSDDYKTLYYGNVEYVVFDNTHSAQEVYNEMNNRLSLNEKQSQEISRIGLCSCDEGIFIDATIKYNDGITMELNYIREDYLDVYKSLLTSMVANCEIDFVYPANNVVNTNRINLKGEKVSFEDRYYDASYEVTAISDDGKVSAAIGVLMISDDNYCYIDYLEIGSSYYEFDMDDYNSVQAYLITDPDTIAAIEQAQENYYSDGLGFFDDDTFTKSVADIFLVTVFAVIPFALFVLFLILACRAKKLYKKLYFTISIFSIAEVIIFAIIAILAA